MTDVTILYANNDIAKQSDYTFQVYPNKDNAYLSSTEIYNAMHCVENSREANFLGDLFMHRARSILDPKVIDDLADNNKPNPLHLSAVFDHIQTKMAASQNRLQLNFMESYVGKYKEWSATKQTGTADTMDDKVNFALWSGNLKNSAADLNRLSPPSTPPKVKKESLLTRMINKIGF